MLTEMACPSDRMRLKDKIIANIAKAIKGIQEAVFFRNRAQVDDGPLVLRNNDRQCHKLCENLDHVFLHGLRHVTNGYWRIATEFTHKNAVREIERLQNVTTNLGRGRAWIFMSLNECVLESYIRLMLDNVRFLRKHYVKEALLLDQQQMSVLLTLTSGLECVEFRFEYDLPYLDLSAYPPRTRTASEIEEEEADHVSLRSMGSLSSRHNSETAASTPESAKALTDSDTASVNSLDAAGLRRNSTRISTLSTDSGCPADLLSLHSNKQRSVTPTDTMSVSSHGSAGEPDRMTRVENVLSVTDDVEEGEGKGLEVIRVKGAKNAASKRKKSAKKSGKKAAALTTQSSAPDMCPGNELGSGDDLFMVRSASEGGADWSQGGTSLQNAVSDGPVREMTQSCDTVNDSMSMLTSTSSSASASSSQSQETKARTRSQEASAELEKLAVETRDSLESGFAQLNSTAASIRAKTASPIWQSEDTRAAQSPSTLPIPEPDSFQNAQKDFRSGSPSSHNNCPELPAKHDDVCDIENNMSALQTESQVSDEEKEMSALEAMESRCAQLCQPVNGEHVEVSTQLFLASSESQSRDLSRDSNTESSRSDSSKAETEIVVAKSTLASVCLEGCENTENDEDEVDFYGAPSKYVEQITVNNAGSYGQLEDYMDYISGRHDNQLLEPNCNCDQLRTTGPQKETAAGQQGYSLRLDNNTKLQIMLEIFSRDDEDMIKMFVTREGHTEGELKTLFVLVTNYVLYFLTQRGSDRKFETELRMQLRDISFISLGLNKQIMNIESSGPSRRKKRIWLTPGDHLLAQEILDCLDAAVKSVVPPTALTSHFSVGSDALLQTIALRKYIARDSHCQEQEVEVEDYSLVCWEDTQAVRNKQMSTEREGTLLLRVNDPFKGHLWKPVFVVLRDSMLCVFGQKSDSKPQQHVRLDGEQCVGCRLETALDRQHCIEIILAKGGSWYLSAASFEEVSAWRQSLCMAVSEGVQDSLNLSCLPCVSVVTKQKLLLCHEDVQTKFCRTIASAKVEEVTSLAFDPEVNTYCVVEFESQEVGVSSECWVLYFNAAHEMDRFVSALSKVWQEVYQVGLVPVTLEDLPLQKRCQDQVQLLRQALAIK